MPTAFQFLKSVADLRAGVPARDLKVGGEADEFVNVRVLSPAFIRSGRVQWVSSQETLLPPDLVARHAIKQGNVIVSARGEFVAGLVDVEPTELSGGRPLLAGPLCHVITLGGSKDVGSQVAPEFIAWLLGTEYARSHVMAASRGAATPLFSLESLGSIPVPMIGVEKQKRIAAAAAAGRKLREARIKFADLESFANESDLNRLAGIES